MEWVAHYIDGTKLHQYEKGKEILFKEIKQDLLISFELKEGDKVLIYRKYKPKGFCWVSSRMDKNVGTIVIVKTIGDDDNIQLTNCDYWYPKGCYRHINDIDDYNMY